MRGSLSMLAALSACISAAAAVPQPRIAPRGGQKKPHYPVVPLEPGDGAPGQGSHASSAPVTVVKTVVEKQSPVTRVIVKTARPQTVTKLLPLPTTKFLPAASDEATTMGLVTPGASPSSAAVPEPPASPPTDVAAAPSAPTLAPSAAAPSSSSLEATQALATKDGPLIDATPSTSALAMAPTTLSAVATLQPWLPSSPSTSSPSAVPEWDKHMPTAYPAWNGTVAYRYRRS